MKKYLLILFVFLSACHNSEEKEPYILQANAQKLLTNDSVKTWKISRRFNDGIRMNMGDCFLSYRIAYAADGKVQDNNAQHSDCGPSLTAQWKFVKDAKKNHYIKFNSPQLPELLGIDKKYKYFKVLHLSADELIIEYSHRQFSDKLRTVTDHYVPEHIKVEDRAFHW